MNISFIIGNLGSDAEVKESNGSFSRGRATAPAWWMAKYCIRKSADWEDLKGTT